MNDAHTAGAPEKVHNLEQVFSKRGLADRYERRPQAVQRWVARGWITPSFRIGRDPFFLESAVLAFEDRMRRETDGLS